MEQEEDTKEKGIQMETGKIDEQEEKEEGEQGTGKEEEEE